MLSSKVTIVDLFMNIIVKYMSSAISCLFVSKKKRKRSFKHYLVSFSWKLKIVVCKLILPEEYITMTLEE